MTGPSIYALSDPQTGALRYIGKANNPANRLKGHLRDSGRRNTPVYAWIRKLKGKGMAPVMSILEADCSNWQESERRLIANARARGEALLNLADGGEQPECPIEVQRANGSRTLAWLKDSKDTKAEAGKTFKQKKAAAVEYHRLWSLDFWTKMGHPNGRPEAPSVR